VPISRDAAAFPFLFPAIIALEPHCAGTHLAATATQRDSESRAKRDAIGFRVGWGKALDKLVDMAKAEG